MPNHNAKPQRKSFRESEDFQRFQELLRDGFITAETDLPKPELLDFTEQLAKILRRSDRHGSDTLNHFRRVFQRISGLRQVRDPVELEVSLRLLKAQLTYAEGRQAISRNFGLVMQKTFDRLLECDQIVPQLPGLYGFFEALYAYYYYQTQRDMRRRRS